MEQKAFPTTLESWRYWKQEHRGQRAHTLWEPLAPFFAQHGLILFKPKPEDHNSTPDLPDPTEIRAADDYHHWEIGRAHV